MTTATPTFLVTGATGFVGHRLVSRLVKTYGPGAVTAMVGPRLRPREQDVLRDFQRQNIRVIQCDLMELPRLNIEVPPFDIVYHLAAYVETETASAQVLVNTVGTTNLLTWLGPNLAGKRVVFTSTLVSVDRKGKPTGPMTESTPCQPRADYGRTKLEAEKIILRFSDSLGFEYTILRLCTILGADFRAGGMFAVFPEMLRKNSLGTRLNWPGKTSLVDVADLVEILVRTSMLAQSANQVYLLSNGEDPPFDDLLEQIARTLDLPRRRIVMPAWFWSTVGVVANAGAEAPFLPHTLQTFCWRVSLMVYDGIYADASKLNAAVPLSYRPVRESLRVSYGVSATASSGEAHD